MIYIKQRLYNNRHCELAGSRQQAWQSRIVKIQQYFCVNFYNEKVLTELFLFWITTSKDYCPSPRDDEQGGKL
ncbi:MAG TPA: hypothetical protein DIV86_00110 [Alphaproteobacteria bacterium]|nr:hypothetical protein [Alphaproteobacteria bacterium]